jgi:hypothetical protein
MMVPSFESQNFWKGCFTRLKGTRRSTIFPELRFVEMVILSACRFLADQSDAPRSIGFAITDRITANGFKNIFDEIIEDFTDFYDVWNYALSIYDVIRVVSNPPRLRHFLFFPCLRSGHGNGPVRICASLTREVDGLRHSGIGHHCALNNRNPETLTSHK